MRDTISENLIIAQWSAKKVLCVNSKAEKK